MRVIESEMRANGRHLDVNSMSNAGYEDFSARLRGEQHMLLIVIHFFIFTKNIYTQQSSTAPSRPMHANKPTRTGGQRRM